MGDLRGENEIRAVARELPRLPLTARSPSANEEKNRRAAMMCRAPARMRSSHDQRSTKRGLETSTFPTAFFLFLIIFIFVLVNFFFFFDFYSNGLSLDDPTKITRPRARITDLRRGLWERASGCHIRSV